MLDVIEFVKVTAKAGVLQVALLATMNFFIATKVFMETILYVNIIAFQR